MSSTIKKLLSVLLILILLFTPALIPAAYASESSEAPAEFDGYLVRIRSEDELFSLMATDDDSLERVGENLYFAEDAEAILSFAKLVEIENVEPNYIYELQDDYTSSRWNVNAINALYAWNHLDDTNNHNARGDGITIAVIDSGLDRGHEDLNSANILSLFNLTNIEGGINTGHGTSVTGIIAAQLNNRYIDGIAPNVLILPISVFENNRTTTSKILVAIDHAIEKKADVINLSLGGTGRSGEFEKACQKAVDAGIIVVAAAGNYTSATSVANRGPNVYIYPASYDCVISVTACKQNGSTAVFDNSYSFYNDQVTVAAPGSAVATLDLGNKTATKNGTSFAAPVVSGMAAIAKQQNKRVDTDTLVELLRVSSKDLGAKGYDVNYGHGLVDIQAFVDLLTKTYTITYYLNDEGTSFIDFPGLLQKYTNTSDDTYLQEYTFSSDDIILPIPTREGYTFGGWYDNEQLSGDRTDILAAASFGDRNYHASWIPSDDCTALSVTVAGYSANWSEEAEAYKVLLPKDTIVSADVISVTAASLAAVSEVTTAVKEGDGTWTFTITSLSGKNSITRYLIISYDRYTAPLITGSALSGGTATPASLDKKTSVKPFEADISDWFAGDGVTELTIELLPGNGYLTGNSLTYIPTAQDADSTVVLSLIAKDTYGFSSDIWSIQITVGSLPVSNSAIIGSSDFEWDLIVLPPAHADEKNEDEEAAGDEQEEDDIDVLESIDIVLALYGNTVEDVIIKSQNAQVETTLIPNSDYFILEAAVSPYDAVSVTEDYLSTLDAGTYTLTVTFNAGAPVTATLNIVDTTPQDTPQPTPPTTSDPSTVGGGISSGSNNETYIITASADNGGSISPNGETVVNKNASATYTITPAEDYEISDVLVDNKSVGPVDNYTFLNIQSAHTINAQFTKVIDDEAVALSSAYDAIIKAFVDIEEGAYYYAPLLWAIESGITNGSSATTFSPEINCTRAQIAVFLWRAFGSPEPDSMDNAFTDICDDDYYYEAVLWAFEQGITNGTGESTFNPEQDCTRAQIVVFLWRALGSPEPISPDNPFIDVNLNAYYYEAVMWAFEQEITTGTSEDMFSPQAGCTRAQIITFLYRAFSQDAQTD